MLDLEGLRRKHSVSGVAAAILEDGIITWEGYSGFADEDKPIDDATVFHVASLSKPLFAYGAVTAAMQGEFSLDAHLGPAAMDWGNSEDVLSRIKISDVLCHCTGLPNWIKKGEPLQLSAPPGRQFGYCSVGYYLAQKTIESLTGFTFLEWIQQTLVKLRLSARFTYEPGFDGRIAIGHGVDGKTLPHHPRSEPMAPSSLHSTLRDYGSFLSHVLRLDQEGSEETRIMFTRHAEVSGDLGWGLGWGLIKNGDLFCQYGDNFHSRACFVCSSDTQRGALILTNSHNGLALCKDTITGLFSSSHGLFDWIETQ